MLQRDIGVLAERLLGAGRRVMIETSGAHDLARLPQPVIRIVDVKTPASGESHRMRWEILPELRPMDAAKFVVADEPDYHWATDVVAKYELGTRTEVLFSPVHGRLNPQDLVAWMLRDRVPARLNLQLHKYVWAAETRGV